MKSLDRTDVYGDEIAKEAERLRVETMGLLRVNQLALLAVDTLFTLGTGVAASVMAALRLSAGAIRIGEAVAIVLLGVMLIEPLSATSGGAGSSSNPSTTAVAMIPDPSTAIRSAVPTAWAATAAIELCGEPPSSSRA